MFQYRLSHGTHYLSIAGDLDALSEEVEKLRRDVIGRIFGVGMSLLQMLLLVGGSLSLAVSSKLFS